MADAPPKRLSAHDSVFLSWERPEQPMHVAECMVYDGHITAADMLAMIRERMHLLPRYRQKVVPAPFGVAHPTWEDDCDFDVANHVEERTLPAPGDDRVLSRVCGELYCGLLERDRPLWHLTVLHGHASGGTVIFLKLHHAMVDGVSSVELIEVLHATERGAPPPPPPSTTWQPRPVGGRLERLRHVVADQAATALDGAREMSDLIRPGAIGALAQRMQALGRAALDTGPLLVRPLPPTPFNAPIHPARDFAWVELPLAEVRSVRAALGGTINDLVLAILSGGLARYMCRHGFEPDGRELQAMCPVSVRRQDQSGAMGNLVSMVVAPLYVGIGDGPARLEAERAAMQELKRRQQALGIYEVIAAANWWPAPMWRLVWKLWPRTYFPFHITSTNVPGPRRPLFLGDHELLHWYPFGVQWTNNALFLCTLATGSTSPSGRWRTPRSSLTSGSSPATCRRPTRSCAPPPVWLRAPVDETPGLPVLRYERRRRRRAGTRSRARAPRRAHPHDGGERLVRRPSHRAGWVSGPAPRAVHARSRRGWRGAHGGSRSHPLGPRHPGGRAEERLRNLGDARRGPGLGRGPIPPNVADEVAAAAIEAYGTASYALEERGGLRAGERLLVLGASGAVGAAAVEIAVHLDAEVIALTSDPTMWDHHPVRPHLVLDRRAVHLREAIKERFPDGIDVVLDPVGGDLAELALRSLGPRGRYLVIGFASGHIPKLPANQILLRNRTVVGVEWATWITANPEHLARTLEVVLNRLARGVLHPPKPDLVLLDDLPEVLVQPPPAAGLLRTVVLPS